MNRTPIVGLKKFRFDDRRCGSFVCVRIEGNTTTTGSGARRWSSSSPEPARTRSPEGLPYRCIPRETGSGCTGPTARRRSWEAAADWETKVAASRDHVENGLTKTEAMARHGIASIASLERWCRDYRSGGPEALRPKPKGRPKGARSKPKPEPTREQELAEQVAYLKAKVAYLEKLRTLRASKSRGASEAPSSDCSQGGDTGSATSSR